MQNYKIKYELAKKIKNLCGNINSKVHAYGILSYLPEILEPDEIIIDLNLENDNGFDLVTNERIAEFTFRESSEKSKAADKKIIKDLVSLAFHQDQKSTSDESKKFCLYHTRQDDDIKKFKTSKANALLWIDNDTHIQWLKKKFKNEIIRANGKLYVNALFKYLEEKIHIVNLNLIKKEQ